MNRDKLVSGKETLKHDDFIQQVAFHEAGHAAAIYLRNQQFNLPPVHFHISLVGFNVQKALSGAPWVQEQALFQPLLEGGLLHGESWYMPQNANCSSNDCMTCRAAYEADVINLMAGPLAEAMHVASRDGELINQHLVGLHELKNYGGNSDLQKVENYLDIYSKDPAVRKAKLNELYAASFEFVSKAQNWRAIKQLAQFIVRHDKELISYQESIDILDSALFVAN